MSILAKSYHLVNQNDMDADSPKVIPRPRAIADELVLLSALMPLAISDLGSEYFPRVFATDASSTKGAVCWTHAPLRTVSTLWKSCRCKGSDTRILYLLLKWF